MIQCQSYKKYERDIYIESKSFSDNIPIGPKVPEGPALPVAPLASRSTRALRANSPGKYDK